MREVMASSEVGDDVYREDPTVSRLEARVAELLGKEHALFVPSGTMANQIALLLHTRPGDEVIIAEGTHCAVFESGAAAALSGVQFSVAGSGGRIRVDELERAVQPDAYWLPRSRLVVLENTHNRSGGKLFPLPELEAVSDAARERGLGVHLDGARLWNASVASGVPLARYARAADTVSVCFSKGLGAPVGSALVLSREHYPRALRLRRMLGGAMRQSGVLASAALFALEHNLERLAEDHSNAQALARGLTGVPGARVDPGAVESNIVNIELSGPSAENVIAAARNRGVLLGSIARNTLRAVTHLDVSRADCLVAAEALALAIEEAKPRA